MIFTQKIYDTYCKNKNSNILVYGNNLHTINHIINKEKYLQFDYHTYIYHKFRSNYIIDLSHFKDKHIFLEFLIEITTSINHYNTESKKNIILFNIQIPNDLILKSIQTIIDKSYITSVFLIHTTKLHLLSNLKNNYSKFSLSLIPLTDQTNDISYKKIIKLLRSKLTVEKIEQIRELSYHYYMNHKSSIELQKMLVVMIGNNPYIPNPIKYQFISDIAKLNTIYKYSFRKPIYFESMIISLFKNLEHYTTNL